MGSCILPRTVFVLVQQADLLLCQCTCSMCDCNKLMLPPFFDRGHSAVLVTLSEGSKWHGGQLSLHLSHRAERVLERPLGLTSFF